MTTGKRTEKVIALIGTWWDGVGVVDHRIELLKPLRFNKTLLDAMHLTSGGTTYLLWLHGTMFDVIRDLATLITDDDDRAPSLHNIVKILRDPEVVKQLRFRATQPLNHSGVISVGVPVDVAQRQMSDWMIAAQADDTRDFDTQIGRALPLAEALLKDPLVAKFKSARDKALAHIDMVMKNGRRLPFSISDVDLKWGDPEELLAKLDTIGDDLHVAITGLSIAAETRRRYNRDSVEDFYRRLCPQFMSGK